jgi:catalase
MNPRGRANYEPNSWGSEGGPRESAEQGFRSYPSEEQGPKQRTRSETFADHYSQARQFYISQTSVEQQHIIDAFTFELSKVETPAIRSRMVSHLMNVHPQLAEGVARGLRLEEMPVPAEPARPTREDLQPSPALSILENGPESFAGRKVGVLVSDGVDMGVFEHLRSAVTAEGAMLKVIAPHIGGVRASDGTWIEADEKVDGGPSVVFDAVAVLVSAEGAATLAKMPPARDFVTDAFAHMKFIGYTGGALALLEKTGVAAERDPGFLELDGGADDCRRFIEQCRQVRYWARHAGGGT